MTASIDTGLQDLGRRHPEWEPWLAVVEAVVRETTDSKWESFVPARTERQESSVPLLAGITLAMDMSAVSRWIKNLFEVASQSGAPQMSTLKIAKHTKLSGLALFRSSLCQDRTHLRGIAAELGVDAAAFEAVALLVPVPLLHACDRRWAVSKFESWTEGYCPVCGAWPAFAEVRGIERSRYLRCGRCGGEWQAHCLFCPYCGMTDHEKLLSLVPEKSGATGVIDVCKRCLGYVKTFTTLQGSPPAKIILDDLATVALDVAALEQGYRRPEGLGYSLDITVVDKPSLSERIFPWRA